MRKLILITILLSFSSLYSQNIKTERHSKEFAIEVNNVEELKDIKWKKLKHFFKPSDKNDFIRIVIIINNESKKSSKSKIQLNSIKSDINGQAFELNKMIRKAKKMTKEMIKTEKELSRIGKRESHP